MINPLRIITLTSFSLISLLSLAQIDSVQVLRFIYEFENDNTKGRNYNDIMNLDVLKDGSSAFYSIYSATLSGQSLAGKDINDILDAMDKNKKGTPFQIFRDFGKNELIFVTSAPAEFYYIENIIEPEWKIVEGDTATHCGYTCQKATSTYMGRTWTAWFTEDIPINAGPWKLCGLPGVILNAYDTDSLFQFTCIGMETTIIAPWHPNLKEYTKCTNAEYQKQYRLQAADPVNYATRMLGLPPISTDYVIMMENGISRGCNSVSIERVYLEKLPGDKR